MKYISTRGASPPLGFIDTLLAGLAPDGGLYMPETWPSLSHAEIAAFAGQPYHRVASRILGLFADGEIAPARLEALCEAAYASFDHAAVTPLTQLYPDRFLLELFHGPTLAFKDVAMQILGRLYGEVLADRGRTMTIVCATSGDTGGAAVEAFRGLANVRIVVLYPEGRISDVQRRFITTADEANVRAVSVAGDFDDCQAILKAMFQDQAFVEAVSLSAVNSINFARIAAQSVYYFTAAVALGGPDRPVSFVTPTGNFGDAFAAHAAAMIGLPIERIVAATNANDIVARALRSGEYRRGNTRSTQSPAMDIQVASNFERLYFECCGRDPTATGEAFRAFSATGAMIVPDDIRARIGRRFAGDAVDEPTTAASIAEVWGDTGVLIDPHTAVAAAAAARLPRGADATPLVILSTAHPAKFPEAVQAAAGVAPPPPRAVTDRAGRLERIDRLPAEIGALKAYVRDFVLA